MILDGHKLPWHMDRIAAWEVGERIAPITIDMALTRACDASCFFCYAMLQESQTRANITTDVVKRFLDDCATMGVRGISLVSDGESTLSSAYVPFIQHARMVGIDVASGTNGRMMTPEVAEQVLPCLTYLRFNVSGGTPRRYASIMYSDPGRTDIFFRVMNNVSTCVALKRKLKLAVTIGTQMVLSTDDEDQIIPFAQLSLDLGVDYAVIKHCSDDEMGSLGIDYSKYEQMYDKLWEAQAMSTEQTQIVVKWSKIQDEGKCEYARVYGPPFLLQMSGSGLVAPAGVFFNARYSKLHIGNIVEEPFIDIWRSERYWDAMNYLASPAFNAPTMQGTLPIQHMINTALDRHIKGIERIQAAVLPPPLHVNFV